jgi:hypothetical protein
MIQLDEETSDGLRPSFSAHVRWRERGAPGLVRYDLGWSTTGLLEA